VPAWKRWAPILLRPEGLYATGPAEGGNKAAKLKAKDERDEQESLLDLYLRAMESAGLSQAKAA
jgi:hypothetical protein